MRIDGRITYFRSCPSNFVEHHLGSDLINEPAELSSKTIKAKTLSELQVSALRCPSFILKTRTTILFVGKQTKLREKRKKI